MKNFKLWLNQTFCRHKFGDKPSYQCEHYRDIRYYTCEKCGWEGYRGEDSLSFRECIKKYWGI